MVKMENENFSLPDSWAGPRSAPDVPPGFPPQTPKTCTSSAAAVESSRNQNPTPKENVFLSVHGQIQSPDFSAEQPPRRSSRKRTRPKFYEPPTRRQQAASPRRIGRPPKVQPAASPRRRGRPPKARLLSLFSSQETQNRNSDEVSSTPLRSPQDQMPCFVTSVLMTKEQSSSQANNQVGEHGSQINISPSPNDPMGQETNMINGKAHDISVVKKRARTVKRSTFHAQDRIEETLIDISLTEVPRPVSACERVRNACRKNKISDGIDAKILQHVANALQYVSVDGKKVKSRSSDFDKNLARMLKAINEKHGDITRDCSLESDCMKTLVLLGICKVVQDLQKKQLKDLDISSLDSYYTAVKDAENMKVNVQWLHNRLDEIKEAVNLLNEAKGMVTERNRHLENVDRKKKELLLRKVELERLKSEVQDIEEQLTREAVMVEELNKKFSDQMSKISQFQHTYLMDGLI